MELVLSENRWLSRLFFWALGIVDAFLGKEMACRHRKGTNLCHLVRVIVVYLPLVLLAQLLFWATFLGACLVFPIWWFGVGDLARVAGLIVAGVAIVIGAAWLAISIEDTYRQSKEEQERRKRLGIIPEPTMANLALAFIAARKRKICPLIKFRRNGGVSYE